MPYNTLTERAKLNMRLTARQALPRNYLIHNQRNLQKVRHAHPPSNDEYLAFESVRDANTEAALLAAKQRIEEIIEEHPKPTINDPVDGAVLGDPLYPISGTAGPDATVDLYSASNADPVATTTSDGNGNYIFDGDRIAKEGVDQWHVVSGGRESDVVTITLYSVATITSPTDGEIMDDPLYPIVGTAPPNSTVDLYNEDGPDAVATTTSNDRGIFKFDGDTPAKPGDTTWRVLCNGVESDPIVVTLDTSSE